MANTVEIVITDDYQGGGAPRAAQRDLTAVRREVRGLEHDAKRAERAVQGMMRGTRGGASGGGTRRNSAGQLIGDNGRYVAAGVGAGKAFTSGLNKAIGAGFDALPAQAKAGVAVAGAAVGAILATGLAATISAGVIAATVAPALAIGIKYAAKDPRVINAWEDVGTNVDKGLGQRSKVFAEPLIQAAKETEALWQRNSKTIGDALADASKFVQPLFDGLEGAADRLIPAIARGIQRAGPVIDAISKSLTNIGIGTASAIDDITENADEAASAIVAIGDAAAVTIAAIGKGVSIGTAGWREFLQIGGDVTGFLEDIAAFYGGGLGKLLGFDDLMSGINDEFERLEAIAEGRSIETIGGQIGGANNALIEYGNSAGTAADQMKSLVEWQDKAFGKIMGLSEAQLTWNEGVLGFKAAWEAGTGALNTNTEKGIENQRLVNGLIADAWRLREAELAAGDGSFQAMQKADAAYQARIEQIKAMLRALGLTEQQINVLIAGFKELAKPLTKVIKIRVDDDAARLGYRPGGGNGTQTAYAHGGVAGGGRRNRAPRQAAGGVTPSWGGMSGLGGGSLAWVGDGPGSGNGELVNLPFGSSVKPRGQSNEMMRKASSLPPGAAGGGSSRGLHVSADPNEVSQMLAFLIRRYVRDNGGSAEAALGFGAL